MSGSSSHLAKRSNNNLRFDCPLCDKKQLLYTSFGSHIIKHHLPTLFDANTPIGKRNRATILREKYLKNPIPIDLDDKEYYVCFGCHHFFSNTSRADDHFYKNKTKCLASHTENIERLRTDYPKPDGVVESNNGFSPSDIKVIQEAFWTLYEWSDFYQENANMLEERHEPREGFDYSKVKYKRLEDERHIFKKLPLDLKYETLKKLFDEPEPEPEGEPETSLDPPEEQEETPLVFDAPKSLTNEEVFQTLFNEKERKEIELYRQEEARRSSLISLNVLKEIASKPSVPQQPTAFPKIINTTRR